MSIEVVFYLFILILGNLSNLSFSNYKFETFGMLNNDQSSYLYNKMCVQVDSFLFNFINSVMNYLIF